MQYHEKCATIQEAMDNMNKLIENQLADASQTHAPSVSNDFPEGCVPIEIENAMNDFKVMAEKDIAQTELDLQGSIAKFNKDQRRVFDKISLALQCEDKVLRMFVSGPGGTGKSFIIENLVSWNKMIRGKNTVVTAPTGIAAYNIHGLTIHRLLHLPVEHGCTAKYKELSAAALKQIRQTLTNADLIIIDEISMVSNVMFMYIHLRLTEIFDTSDSDDGFFGKINIVLFGDLLQLPPVREDFPFVHMTKDQMNKYIGGMNAFNLWELFTYDELTINMRQKDDKTYSEILSRVRLGVLTTSDIRILETRKLTFSNQNSSQIIQELCEYFNKLPADTVCLLPTRNMCDILNTAMIRRIDSEEINLIANDSFTCAKNLQKKVSKILNDNDDNVCGVDRIITIKIGSKIMLRRNIDVSVGLVNGTIATVLAVSTDKGNEITDVRIALQSGEEHSIPRFEYKLLVMDKVYISRRQFPICNSYGITIHKSQGLSLQNAVVETGNSVFTDGQTYVALSRVTKLSGLHLINFDPSCCTASTSAILEYNQLRAKYRPDLQPFDIQERKEMKRLTVHDVQWVANKIDINNNNGLNRISDTCWNMMGLINKDGVSCYANACVQSLFHSITVRRILSEYTSTDAVKTAFNQYVSKSSVDIQALSEFAGENFTLPLQQDVTEFLIYLCNKSSLLQNALKHELSVTVRCPGCDERTNPHTTDNYILSLCLPRHNRSYTLQEIIDYNIGSWQEIEGSCSNRCKLKRIQITRIVPKSDLLVLQLLIFHYNGNEVTKLNNFKINDVPRTKVCINNKRYKVINAIFHYGTTVQCGHYINMLRENNQWFQVDDLAVSKKSWPKSAKDAYVLFLERI